MMALAVDNNNWEHSYRLVWHSRHTNAHDRNLRKALCLGGIALVEWV